MKRRSLLFVLSAFAAACARKKEKQFNYGEPQKKYALRGVVVRLQPEDRIAVVQHEKVEGWMEAMTMEFPVPDPSEFSKLKPGSHIRATVCVNDLYFWLTSITVE